MPSSDIKIRYSIAIATALLFLLAVSSSFGQSSVNTDFGNGKTNVQKINQSDPLVDPLSPSKLNSEKKVSSENSGNILYHEGRTIQVDNQGIQSLAVPNESSPAPEKSKSDLHRKD